MVNILAKIFGTKNDRDLKAMDPTVEAINKLEPTMKAMSDEELAAQTTKFRERLAKGETLDDIMVEAFATVREASFRAVKMRPFDVQVKGGIALHQGKISEMQTGEGKTLVATMPAYLNALTGKGVHVITVNDYLAKRDSDWMGKIYKSLGLTVGAVVHDMNDAQRKDAYAADITYGTNNEFGFDYLRDNMKFSLEERVQRGHNFAIVDEVDSILIDEARTPLIISGPSGPATDVYERANKVIPYLKKGEEIESDEPGEKITTGDFTVDEKHKNATLTEEGVAKVEKVLGLNNLYDPENLPLKDAVVMAVKAHALYERDKSYVVKNGEIIIIDEFTGRLSPGRRWSEGLHQAIEAKEAVRVQSENQTLATITYQNYFRMYKKLSGMTGTAATEAAEFEKIYKLEVVQIPTNKKSLRQIFNDTVYGNENYKFNAAVQEIIDMHKQGRPVLVGTVSVEKSEKLSQMLTKAGVPHEVLNAKNNAREAAIVAQAGRKGAVTVSTNMAGRGTDIKLGGDPDFAVRAYFQQQGRNPDDPASVPKDEYNAVLKPVKEVTDKEHEEVAALGGLHVIGTERHESRRVDNQLMGRGARQGDPGSVHFILSLQDSLVRIFGGDRLRALMERLGLGGEAIESGIITRGITSAQKGVEQQNFDARKQLIEYDDVMNEQRQIVYSQRDELLKGESQKDGIVQKIKDKVKEFADQRLPETVYAEGWDWDGFGGDIMGLFGVRVQSAGFKDMDRPKILEAVSDLLVKTYKEKEATFGEAVMRNVEQVATLAVIDEQWRAHLLSMDYLKKGIGLRGYGQLDPLREYKKEAYNRFEAMMDRINEDSLRYIFAAQYATPEIQQALQPQPTAAVLDPDAAKKAAELAAATAANQFNPAAVPPVTTEAPAVQTPATKPQAPKPAANGG